MSLLDNGIAVPFSPMLHCEASRAIFDASLSFAEKATKDLDEVIDQIPKRSSTFFPLIFPPRAKGWTHTNQFTLAMGGLSFFLYAFGYLLAQSRDERIITVAFDSVSDTLVNAMTELRNKVARSGSPTRKGDTQNVLAELHNRYATAPRLIGEDVDDHNCVVWLAAQAIVENINNPFAALVPVVWCDLLEGLVALDLSGPISRLSNSL